MKRDGKRKGREVGNKPQGKILVEEDQPGESRRRNKRVEETKGKGGEPAMGREEEKKKS